MNDRLMDPFSPVQSEEDAADAYQAMFMAANSGDAELAMKIAGVLVDSTWADDNQVAHAALSVGRALMSARRYDEAKAWLQKATQYAPDVAEEAYNELAELARWQGAASTEVGDAVGPDQHLKVAREALGRNDYATAAAEALKIFEYDAADVWFKAAASIVAAPALRAQGYDDQAELYADWARQHGDADQQMEAAYLLESWKQIAGADRTMDDGVSKREVRQVLDAAHQAQGARDWPTVQHLVDELLASGAQLTTPQADEAHLLLGEAHQNQQHYPEAIAAYQKVVDDSIGFAKYAIQDIQKMEELREQM